MSNGPQKVTDPICVNPPLEGLSNNAKACSTPQNGTLLCILAGRSSKMLELVPGLRHHRTGNTYLQPIYGGAPKPIHPQWAQRDTMMSRGKSCRETILSLNCLAVTITAGAILKEEKMPSLVGERQFWGHFRRQFGRG